MKKIILSVITVFSLICPSLIIVLNQPVHACPVKEPETLLSLVKESETIHRARFTSQVVGEPKAEGEDYSVAEISKHFDVLATHKGKSAEKVTIFDKRYIYKSNPAEAEVEPEDGETPPDDEEAEETAPEEESTTAMPDEEFEGEEMVELKPGDVVLLFLRSGDESGRLELTDYRDGLKQLPREAITIYESRIKELNTILAREKPNVEKIVDWLIRCAEEPATRWEGTYELDRSFNALEYKLAREAEEKENPNKEGGVRSLGIGRDFNHEYAEAMNEYHRQTLTSLLVNADVVGAKNKDKKNVTVHGDRELMNLVSRWAGPGIAQVLAQRLRSGGLPADENSSVMYSIASILKDKKLDSLADEFQDNAYQRDNDRVETEDRNTEIENDSSKKDPEVKTVDPVIEPAKTEESAATNVAPVEVPKKVKKVETYGQLRCDIIERFLARADKLILGPESVAEKQMPRN